MGRVVESHGGHRRDHFPQVARGTFYNIPRNYMKQYALLRLLLSYVLQDRGYITPELQNSVAYRYGKVECVG